MNYILGFVMATFIHFIVRAIQKQLLNLAQESRNVTKGY